MASPATDARRDGGVLVTEVQCAAWPGRRAVLPPATARITVPRVWHPVGQLPVAVYWRRRLLVLALVLVVLGGAGWLGIWLLTGRDGGGTSAGEAPTALPTPGLERVVPSLSAVTTPSPPSAVEAAAPAAQAPPPPPPAPAPIAGGPCTDDMLTAEVRTPGTAAVGGKPVFELVVANVSPVPCVRAFDKGLQEFLLLDLAGARLWGSNDCFPEASSELRTLAPGEVVAVPVVWGGLTSEPTCTASRNPPAPGSYVVRGRLDTKVSPDAPVTLR